MELICLGVGLNGADADADGQRLPRKPCCWRRRFPRDKMAKVPIAEAEGKTDL